MWRTLGKRRHESDASGLMPSTPSLNLERLAASTLLYCCAPRALNAQTMASGHGEAVGHEEHGGVCLMGGWAGPAEFTAHAPAPGTVPAGMRICEYMLNRSARVARMATAAGAAWDALPEADAVKCLGCDAGQSIDGNRVLLLTPNSLLRLVDDDKQAGLVQATLPDMFFRCGLRQQQLHQ